MSLVPFIATGIGLGAVYGMAAVGLVVLYRSSGTINFAFGALGAAAAHCTWALIEIDVPVWLAWLCGVLLATLLSFLYGRYVSSRLADRSQSMRAIATLGFALLLLGAITTVWGPGLPRRLSLPTDYMNVVIFGMKISYTRLGALFFAVVSMIGMGLLLARTRIGLAMRALATSRAVSSQIGIDVAAVDSVAWVISGAFAGISGLILADLLVMSPIPLTFLVIPAIAAAMLGSLTSMPGAFAGGMIAGLAEALLTVVPQLSALRSAAPYVIALLFIALVTRPLGERGTSMFGKIVSAASKARTSLTARYRQLVARMLGNILLAACATGTTPNARYRQLATRLLGKILLAAFATRTSLNAQYRQLAASVRGKVLLAASRTGTSLNARYRPLEASLRGKILLAASKTATSLKGRYRRLEASTLGKILAASATGPSFRYRQLAGSMSSKVILAASGSSTSLNARHRQLAVIAVLFLVVAVIIGTLSGGFWLINLTAAYAIMLALMGTSVLFGQLGLVSLCQYALVGVGGWISLWLFHAWKLPFELTMLAGGLAAALVGVIWGLPALRFRGIYLALVTLMLASAFQAFINAYNFPVGGTGLTRVLMERPGIAQSDLGYFFYTAIVCLVGLILVEAHRRSKPGRAWALIRKDPSLAVASGASVMLYQTWAFALAGFLAGIGGALLAGTYRQLDASGFGASESILLFAASVFGGSTNWVGTLVGGLLVRAVPTLLDGAGISASAGIAIFGTGLIAAVLFGPTGIAGLFDELVEKVASRKAAHAYTDEVAR